MAVFLMDTRPDEHALSRVRLIGGTRRRRRAGYVAIEDVARHAGHGDILHEQITVPAE